MKRLSLVVVAFLAACTSGGATTTTVATTAAPVTTAAASTTVTTALPTTTIGGGCGSEAEDDGSIAVFDAGDSDAEQMAAITWSTDPSCERFSLEFTSAEGAPATSAPSFDATFIRSSAIVRVSIDVEVTAVTDQLVQSGLVDRLYVVRENDRTLFVDFHLSAPALAGIDVAESNIVLTLEPGGDDYAAVASFADNVVVVTPAPGEVDIPITVAGYSRNFEANTVVQVTQDGALVAEDFTTAADWVETWGEFELTIAPDGAGPAELFVGEFSAQDGSPRGLVLDIEY